ncbi:MAG: hypothetical protein JXA79_08475 [Deltaproteobacteria bacterium]|nr:hypothetical protein [Deltaproteobacteria bacterium]
MKLRFVKGHMGGNTIALLKGDQIPREDVLACCLKVLDRNHLDCHEAGILYPPCDSGDVKILVVARGSEKIISACGGMTQVLGLAFAKLDMGLEFGINLGVDRTNFALETDSGLVHLSIVSEGDQIVTNTDMSSFLREIYSEGVSEMFLAGVDVIRVGKFLVVNGDKVRDAYPDVDFDRMDAFTQGILSSIQKEFLQKVGPTVFDYALYDWNPARGNHLRAVFPHRLPIGHSEPSCGTGTIALGVALLETEEIAFSNGAIDLSVETGGGFELGGPEVTRLFLKGEKSKATEATFSHSCVELTAIGDVYVS